MIKLYGRLVASLFFLLFSCVYSCVYAVNIDKIVVFGDSLSDSGNIFSLTAMAHNSIPLIPVIPKDPPYYNGRFSNGLIWTDHLAMEMHAEQINYAYGGSWAEPFKDSKLIIPFGLGMQVNFYLVSSALDFHKENHLYVIWSGGNDYVNGRADADEATTNTVASIQSQIDWLVYYGAKNLLVLNVPDLGAVPEVTARGPDFIAGVRRLVTLHNQKFADMIRKMQLVYPEVKIVSGDTTQYFDDLIVNPDKFHLKNVTQACYDGGYWLKARGLDTREFKAVQAARQADIDILNTPSLRTAYLTSEMSLAGEKSCANPDEYLFWDHIHPTRVVHQLISSILVRELRAHGIYGRNEAQ
ncbi:Phosphatidylcholine-sterol acyltransferase [Aquicella siphonis]|uniref:Phosphatidylcholine-sterol acyltransferase n=1 Tax=Aquicella siphonis TaxID=254247 RepID=A0A5E4PL80_9COXI|nr:SGNH/GDSL hydrolase family protein [Aquicella siphonis]VVC77022.1 Phosphatidylcholine-sterol acyltransferase [Aquicella siphonis]